MYATTPGGWSFGLSYSNGPFRFIIAPGPWYRGGWWGPARYRGYHRGFRHGARHGYAAGRRDASRDNIYRTQRNNKRTVARAQPARSMPSKAGKVSKKPNNVYADKQGNVHRQTKQGWEKHSGRGWDKSSGRDSRNTNQLNKSSNARSRGTSRNQQFRKSSSNRGRR